ncbi:MAG: UDP-N-acetylmuramoyl-tripeptide--D-alanyl-D-alanine ligase, partial [bacterium]|nr:UDP-N-acetylmuramoyl-tripeptide--D-alanyl-D-alanine ligase [bacterium]
MKKIIQLKLKILAKLTIRKYKPKIIGITGTIGKTSTKEAVYTVLSSKFNVRRNIKNYNNEIGLPLTIIGEESAGRNIFGWWAIFWRATLKLVIRDKDYPQILVLEMGIDRPRNMDYLLKIIKPTVGIVTGIDFTHVEFFRDLESLISEKSKLVENISEDGLVIFNIDDKHVFSMRRNVKAKMVTYGFDKIADINADHVRFSFRGSQEDVNNLQGLSFKVTYQGATVPVLMPDCLGIGQIYAALAATAIGIKYNMNLVDISQALRNFRSPTGRMRLLEGIKHTKIIDDTYNASPLSTLAALDTLAKIPLPAGKRRYAILGDMLELGSVSVKSHSGVGKKVQELGCDVLITVGERARDIARGAKEAGMN